MKTISKQLWRSMVFTLILAVLWTAGAAAETPVKNVILLIGDGMGINHITAARLSLAEGAAWCSTWNHALTGFSPLNFRQQSGNRLGSSGYRPGHWFPHGNREAGYSARWNSSGKHYVEG